MGCLAAVAPVSSDYTGGIFGVRSLCAQEGPAVKKCVSAWAALTAATQQFCAEGRDAFCTVHCDAETGDLLKSKCECVMVTPDEGSEGGGN